MPGLQPGRDGRVGRYLRPNDRVWTPPCVITFDTETARTATATGEDQRLRLWCARLDDRRRQKWRVSEQLRADGDTGQELAAVIDGWMKVRLTAWLYCHNLGFDLVTSQLVEHLAWRGWTVDTCSSEPAYLFLTMAKGEHRLTLTDLHHLIPASLAKIGGMIDVPKLSMPPAGADRSAWREYCARDVDITSEAVLTLMSHWDDYGLGNWTLSGASCGFRAMRHMLAKRTITLIDDPDGSANDRAAIYGGRRYCWRHGQQPPGRYSELDFTAAHATTAAAWPMPCKRGGWFDRLDPHHMAIDGRYAVVIAEVEIDTDRPRYPCRIGGRVWYPVGRFRTVLASPEIAWARDNGDLVSIGRGQFHYTSTVMQPFFRRVLETGDPAQQSYPPIASAMWRQWGRSVVGKFAQRGYKFETTAMLTDKAWFYERATDAQTGQEYWLIHKDGRIHKAIPDGDGSQAYPAVLALVESYERVALGKAAELLGDRVAIQCDTDGIWADISALEAGAQTGLGFDLADLRREIRVDIAVNIANQACKPLQLREKHAVDRIAVWGPQNYDAGRHSKHSGRPGRLTEVQPGVWQGEIFPSVARQMSHGAAGVYRTERVTWTRPANAVPGWVLDSGAVRPVEASEDGRAGNQIRPWHLTRWAAAGDRLGPVQHQALDGKWDQQPGQVVTEHGNSQANGSKPAQDRTAQDHQERGATVAQAQGNLLPVPTRPV